MAFDDFVKNPQGFQLNLDSFDKKNGFGNVFFSQSSLYDLKGTIENFGIDRIDLTSKETQLQAQLLIMYRQVIDEIVKLAKELPKPYIESAPRIEVNTITSQAMLDKLVDDKQPLQIFAASEGFVAHLGQELREKLNFGGEYAKFDSYFRSLADTKDFRAGLEREFLTPNSFMHGSLTNMNKIIEANPSLREFFVNNAKFIDTPLNFTANIKKFDIVGLPELDLKGVFGNSAQIAEVLERTQALHFTFGNLNSLEQDFSKVLPTLGIDELSQLAKQLEQLVKVLQLNEKMGDLLDKVISTRVSTKAFDIGGEPNINDKLLDTGAFSIVLSKEEEQEITRQVKEHFIDAPKSDKPTEYLTLSSVYKFPSELGEISPKVADTVSVKQSNTADLSQNVSSAFKNDDESGMKL